MEYIDVLSMIMDSDIKTTREYISLFSVPTGFFVNCEMLSDEPIINKTKDGRFVSVYQLDDIVVLEYYFGGKGSLKSCTKKKKLEFTPDLIEKLLLLRPDKPTTLASDIHHQQLCMVASVYDLNRDNVDFNQIHKNKKYIVCYYLRKTAKDHYFLQSELRLKNRISGNCQLNELSTFNDLSYVWQKILLEKTHSPFVDQFRDKYPDECFDIYNTYDDYGEDDDYDIDYDEDEYDADYDEDDELCDEFDEEFGDECDDELNDNDKHL